MLVNKNKTPSNKNKFRSRKELYGITMEFGE
jgi:hypothetical protein